MIVQSPPQHDREFARIKHRRFHRVRQGEVTTPQWPWHSGCRSGVGRRVLRRHCQPRGAPCMDALSKTETQEPLGQALHSICRQAQRGRGFENCIGKCRHDASVSDYLWRSRSSGVITGSSHLSAAVLGDSARKCVSRAKSVANSSSCSGSTVRQWRLSCCAQ